MNQPQSKQIEVFAIHNDKKLGSDSFQRLFSILPFEERKRNKGFLRWQDAQRNLIGRIAIRSVISERYNIGIVDSVFSENEYGKPYCKSVSDFHFNISHAGEWVVVIVNNSPVGIDVEKISAIELKIAEQVFSFKEYKKFQLMSLSQRKIHFFDVWTLKESYIKADGRGFSIPLNSFSIIADNDEIHVCEALKNYYFKQYNIDRRYKLSVCALANSFPDTVKVIGLEEFIAYISDQLGQLWVR